MDMDIPLQQQQQQQQHRQRHHVQQQQPWPQHQAQGHHEVSKQPLPQNPQQQQQQTLVRDADQRPSPLLSDYVPPAGLALVNVPVLLQQTACAIVRWEELQKNLDVRSDSASANLAAQAHVRSSLKRDLTNLIQLADAQTKHTQKMKFRQMQAMQQQATEPAAAVAAAAAAAQGVQPLPGGRNPARGGTGAGLDSARAGVATGEAYDEFPPKRKQVVVQQPQRVPPAGGALRAAAEGGAANASSYAASNSGPTGAMLMQQGAGGGSGVGGAQGPGPGPGPGAPPSNRHEGIRQRIDRTEPANKWVVLVDASLRLPPGDGTTFEHFTCMIQNFLNNYNGDVGAEVARALGSCLDPRVFDPTDIKRAQERMADICSRFQHGSQQ
ncbi:unnamed protein product [Ectocarpus sp. CCAP 1310/34]|nr:unnamed protein product [Ectocarpus sp. CCAP 1310/34]